MLIKLAFLLGLRGNVKHGKKSSGLVAGITKQLSEKICECTSINLIAASKLGCTTASMFSAEKIQLKYTCLGHIVD
ncbi:hypothetical protein T12_12119 [Trichinella patagoniensis]|uniref:Uncharacterized protein n=1 Tax=Trichinella patagoniensis TaxID=990121 RepID=A0A0V0Z0D9_9BILA|nr:hypothetical protein T12_12119 [Trichinella patagoniensis]